MEKHTEITASFPNCTAFAGGRRIASGSLVEVAVKTKEMIDKGEIFSAFVFDDETARAIDLDFRGTPEAVIMRIQAKYGVATTGGAEKNDEPRGPGRPKLGVVAREVTLLPRHWEWLNEQPGGASVALRKLVEQAKRTNKNADSIRQSQEAAYRFMSAMAGDEVGFEEATRALFAGDEKRFEQMIGAWPHDIQAYAKRLATAALHQAEQ
jgi:hypothetical protein